MSIAGLKSEKDTGKNQLLCSKKPNQQIHFCLHNNGCLFMWGAYSCMGAYKRDVVVVIKMGVYIHRCLFCVGAYCPVFTVCHFTSFLLISSFLQISQQREELLKRQEAAADEARAVSCERGLEERGEKRERREGRREK